MAVSGSLTISEIVQSKNFVLADPVPFIGENIEPFIEGALTLHENYKLVVVDTVGRAVQCALDMQTKMVDYQAIQTQAGTFNLAMKAGLAAGPLLCTTVGHSALRLESVVAGTVLDRCAEAEHHAQAGEVVLHQELLTITDAIAVVPRQGDFSLVKTVNRPVQRAPLPPIAKLSPSNIETIAAYMHPVIAQRDRRALERAAGDTIIAGLTRREIASPFFENRQAHARLVRRRGQQGSGGASGDAGHVRTQIARRLAGDDGRQTRIDAEFRERKSTRLKARHTDKARMTSVA